MSTRATTRAKLEYALAELLAGRPTRTDGELTVSNLCKEAGVGRDSFYRTEGMADTLKAARDNAEATKPELLQLRDQIAELKRAARKSAKDQAADLADLEHTVQTYANQIQALALTNEALKEENQLLRERLNRRDPDVIPLAGRR